jgi:CheY-like chemotaxis protein
MAANILVVDDDRLIRELISKTLRKDGHRVVEACDGALALEILEVMQFDLVITDFVMPKLNGIRFIEQLQHFTEDSIGRRGGNSPEAF